MLAGRRRVDVYEMRDSAPLLEAQKYEELREVTILDSVLIFEGVQNRWVLVAA